MMTTTTTRLAATLEPAPASVTRWAVTKNRKFRSLDGGGFEATVTLDGKVVGTFANEGNGGGTWFRNDTPEAREAFDALCVEWAPANPALLAMPVMTVEDKQVTGTSEPMVTHEHVCDSLVENFDTAKRLNGFVKRGKTPVLTRAEADAADDGGEWNVQFGIKGFGAVNAPITAPGVREWLTENAVALVWHEGAWRDPATV